MQQMVSVIVPIYNSEQTIKKCISSILKQDYNNIELILVDDGSTDNSSRICKSYEKKDTRIRYFLKKNSGVSATRNLGLRMIRGTYVTFIDSDDYIAKDHIKLLVKAINQAEIAAVGLCNVKEGKINSNVLENDYRWDRDEFFYRVVSDNRIGGYLCNKIFIADIIKQNNIRMIEGIKVSEDMMFICEYLKYCNKGNYIAKGTYYYVQNNQSTMRKMYGSNKFDYTKLGNLDVSDKILKIGNQYGKKMKCGAEYRYVRNRLWVLMNMIFCRCKDDELFDRIGLISREQLKSYLKNPQSTVMESICAVGMYINPKLLYYMGVTIGLPIQWIIKRKVLN